MGAFFAAGEVFSTFGALALEAGVVTAVFLVGDVATFLVLGLTAAFLLVFATVFLMGVSTAFLAVVLLTFVSGTTFLVAGFLVAVVLVVIFLILVATIFS